MKFVPIWDCLLYTSGCDRVLTTVFWDAKGVTDVLFLTWRTKTKEWYSELLGHITEASSRDTNFQGFFLVYVSSSSSFSVSSLFYNIAEVLECLQF